MSDLKITGVIDGDLPGGRPKAIELTAVNDIPDLGIYGIGAANNGGGTDSVEFLLSGAANAGDRLYITDSASEFAEFFGFSHNFISSVANINGNDAIELFDVSATLIDNTIPPTVIDVFGDINVDGDGEPWDYSDGWAYRNIDTGPDGDTFNIANWNFSSPDSLDGATSNLAATNPIPIPIVYVVEPDDGTNISESGISDTYDVVLNTPPEATVIVTVTPDAQTSLNGAIEGEPILLTFTPENYNQVQTVAVAAVGNAAATRTITHTVTSEDASYDSNTNNNLVINTNNNSLGNENEVLPNTLSDPGVTITESDESTIVSEGGGIIDSYEIVLNTAPTADVDITVTPDGESSLNGAAAGEAIILTFTPTDFSTPQVITVNGVADENFDGEHTSTITHSAESVDPNYNVTNGLIIPDVTATVLNTGITITDVSTESNLEGTSTIYNVVLNTVPTAAVTVTVDPDDQLDLGADPGQPIQLLFDPTAVNFSQVQSVTAIAVDSDATGEGAHIGTITHTSTSSDSDYVVDSSSPLSVSLNITEPGISIVESDGGTTVSEEGISDQYEVILNSIPTDVVTVTVTPDGQTDLGAGPGTAIQLVFDPNAVDFSQSQTVNVTGVDVEDGTRQASITHSSTSVDPNYDGASVPNVAPTIIDCFLTGTQLLTDEGEKRVEELKIGDRLQTLDGSLERIKWIGIQTCYTNGHNHPLRTYPMRVKAGALGPNCPIRDLYVSPDHALLVEGLLVNAGALENGDTIVQIQPTDEKFVYYHIEMERHSILMADGAPAESYLPQKQDRDTFDNGDEYAELYPYSNMQALMPMKYPRVSSKRQLPRFIAKHLAKYIAEQDIANQDNLQTV